MWCRRNILTISGMLMEKEHCRMHGQVSQDSCYWMRSHLLTRKQTTSRPDNVWPDMWKHMSDAAKKQSDAKNGLSRNQSSMMPEDYVVFCLLNLMMKNSSEEMKNARRCWKFRCQQQRFVDFISTGKRVAQLDNARQNMHVLLRPTNLWGYAWKGLRARTMKTTTQEKAWIHWVASILCTNLFLCLEPWKYQMQR